MKALFHLDVLISIQGCGNLFTFLKWFRNGFLIQIISHTVGEHIQISATKRGLQFWGDMLYY